MSEGGTVQGLPPPALREAVSALWAVPPPGPRNLFSSPEFVHLRHVCAELYAGNCPGTFALGNALDSLGLPCRPAPANRALALPALTAAACLHSAILQRELHRVYLCPLDRSDCLSELSFGPNRIARLNRNQLEELFDLPRLRRINPNWALDAKLLSEFTWLMVNETRLFEHPPEHRIIPWLFEPTNRDWGAIEPHKGRLPAAVLDALFALLLVPWEDWVDTPTGWWRAFGVPWVYVSENDLFRRPSPPPSADALSWDYVLGDDGEEIFVDPNRVPLKAGVPELTEWLTDARWADLVH